MTDAELSEACKAVQGESSAPPGAQAASAIDWKALLFEILRRLLERRSP